MPADDAELSHTVTTPIVITLVHGTWGRGFSVPSVAEATLTKDLRWFEPGSHFRTELDRRLLLANIDPVYDEFVWSGANSIFERDAAAQSLGERLKTQIDRFSGHKRIVIAHSHGGNVAMRALHYLRDETESIRVITMATPFIQMFLQYPESPVNKSYRRLAILTWMTFVLLGLLALVSLIGGFGGGSVVGLIACLLLACLGALFTPWLLLGQPWFSEARSDRVDRLVEASMVPPGKMAPHELLVLRGIEDEAGLTLALGAFGARLGYLLATIGDRLRHRLGGVGALALFGVAFAAELYFRGEVGAIGVAALTTLGAALALITGGSLVCVVCKSSHGRELLAGGLICEVGSASVPDSGTRDLWVATLPIQMEKERGRPMRHSLYDNTFCCATIEKWVRWSFADVGRRVESLYDLRFLMDFVYESPREGLVKFGERLRKSWEETEQDLAEMEIRKVELFGTDEEWAQERKESEEYHKQFLARVANRKSRSSG